MTLHTAGAAPAQERGRVVARSPVTSTATTGPGSAPSRQTGWTGLVARLIQGMGQFTPASDDHPRSHMDRKPGANSVAQTRTSAVFARRPDRESGRPIGPWASPSPTQGSVRSGVVRGIARRLEPSCWPPVAAGLWWWAAGTWAQRIAITGRQLVFAHQVARASPGQGCSQTIRRIGHWQHRSLDTCWRILRDSDSDSALGGHQVNEREIGACCSEPELRPQRIEHQRSAHVSGHLPADDHPREQLAALLGALDLVLAISRRECGLSAPGTQLR